MEAGIAIVINPEYMSFIKELAELSGNVICNYWNQPGSIKIDSKSDDSPVTQADREAEQVLRKAIKERYPDHGIIAEEFGNETPDADYVWVLDPIDGTKSFITHVPLFGTLIGLLHKGEPILGAIHQPILKQLVVGTAAGTELNGKPVRMRTCSELKEATLLTSGIKMMATEGKPTHWNRLVEATRFSRTWGDCYGYLLLVTGQADIMVDPILCPWDILPIIPIIQGAGGKITSWDGQEGPNLKSAIAAHPSIHDQVVALLNE